MFTISLLSNEFFIDFLKSYKSVGAKKSAMTREIKSLTDRYLDVKEAYDRRGQGSPYGWLLGEKIYRIDVDRSASNLERAKKLRSEL